MRSIFFVLIMLPLAAHSQSYMEEKLFAEYLIREGMYTESIFVLNKLRSTLDLNTERSDTLNFYLGKSYFYKEADSSLLAFSRIKGKSFATESAFFQTMIYTEKKSYDQALAQLDIAGRGTSHQCTREFFDHSIRLLEHEHEFIAHYKADTNSCENWLGRKQTLMGIQDELGTMKYHSGFVAGALSVVVPGLGRVFAAKPKQGLASFIPLLFLGLQAYEGYMLGGVDDPRFLVFGSLFSGFYAANIWGSILSVKVRRQEIYDKYYHQIIALMQLPIDKLFAKSGR
ncbi:MAG: hypothetical protein IH946_11670 [Bacteroidetes bacterium]|nr:hypothetical protein [Bacteroidota bacterium]